ncbi:hypothetical protein MSM1_20235 [Mycobacterium sp. SM1]|uniref:hypothetical protein n=1 Tax=Mycobacterium sp. SM1 TaxID=2816243 RepID=UPI001BCE6857|nr:hypothetical protein [Mycobacterium sp. SM1]MBS4730548.1 hypothetical protein [Mycobacterium sp. SM1]
MSGESAYTALLTQRVCQFLTMCPHLVIAPAARISDEGEPSFDGRWVLVHAPSGRPVAAARTPLALMELAGRLSWFDPVVIDPVYLADPAHVDVVDSLAVLFEQWGVDFCEPIADFGNLRGDFSDQFPGIDNQQPYCGTTQTALSAMARSNR